ncbi:MAG TPA: LPS assembly lipoprotein LptE [bacterium]|nr:LPS assembly lipoprotein LptE [bacterium]
MTKKKIAILLIFSFLLCVSCRTTEKYKIINYSKPINYYLPFFSNNSYKPAINEELTNKLNNLLINNAQFNLSNIRETADFIFIGVITNYSKNPEIYTDRDKIQMYKITIDCELKIINNKENIEPLIFLLNASTIYSEIANTAESEKDAVDRLLNILSVKIYNSIVDTFK